MRLKLQPSLSLAFPPVGTHRTALQLGHTTTVCEWLNTVVIEKQPWHFTSMKYEFGDSTRRLSLWLRFSYSAVGCKRSISHERTCQMVNGRVCRV